MKEEAGGIKMQGVEMTHKVIRHVPLEAKVDESRVLLSQYFL